MLENTEGAIKNGQSRETDSVRYKTKTQHNMCWTPLCTNNLKRHELSY
jgi:hypothetical protein